MNHRLLRVLVVLGAALLVPACGKKKNGPPPPPPAGDSFATAYNGGTAPTAFSGTINPSGDVDYWVVNVNVSSPQQCTITLTPPVGQDYDLYLYDFNQAFYASSTNGGSTPDSVTFSGYLGPIYVKIVGFSGASSSSSYNVSVTIN